MIALPKLHYLNTAAIVKPQAHGYYDKTLVVLHETVSPDIPGWTDILGVEKFLARLGYGIHGCIDKEGHIAWAYGQGRALLYHAGGVNEKAIGIELVSDIPLRHGNATRKAAWAARGKQLEATGKLLACIQNAHQNVRLTYVSGFGYRHGVTSHWDVSQHHPESQGHTDCWPVNKGGYFPMSRVLELARSYREDGYTF